MCTTVAVILGEFFSLEKSSFSKHKTCWDKCFEEISLCLDVPLLEFLKIFSYTWDTKQHWFPYTWDTKQHWFRYTWDTMQHLQVLHATFRSGGTFYKNPYPSHSCIGNIYVMHIQLHGKHYDPNYFHPQFCVSEESLLRFPCLVLSELLLDDMFSASSTSLGCSYLLELHLNRLSLERFFFVSRSLGRFESFQFWWYFQFWARVFWMHEAWLVYIRCHTQPIQTIIF